MQTGTIKIFKKNRGFGFVATKDESAEFFFHVRNVNINGRQFPQIGQRVCFDITLTENGPEAVNLQPCCKNAV